MTKGYILYLRTDMCDTEINAGGSVAHTLGVINGFIVLGYPVVCASSALISVLNTVMIKELLKLSNPSWLRFLRWKINNVLSTFFFFMQVRPLCKKYFILCIYQRYSLLNMTGLLLSWWFKKKLILEYNGSEAWIALHWIAKKRLISMKWLMYKVEYLNLAYADYIVVVSEVLKDELKNRGIVSSKILVNPNGVDALFFDAKNIKKEYA